VRAGVACAGGRVRPRVSARARAGVCVREVVCVLACSYQRTCAGVCVRACVRAVRGPGTA
jgi:hypothetical protein